MGWERGYYYRVRKVNGRVVREYVGAGDVAELVAHMDALEREQRRLKMRYRVGECVSGCRFGQARPKVDDAGQVGGKIGGLMNISVELKRTFS